MLLASIALHTNQKTPLCRPTAWQAEHVLQAHTHPLSCVPSYSATWHNHPPQFKRCLPSFHRALVKNKGTNMGSTQRRAWLSRTPEKRATADHWDWINCGHALLGGMSHDFQAFTAQLHWVPVCSSLSRESAPWVMRRDGPFSKSSDHGHRRGPQEDKGQWEGMGRWALTREDSLIVGRRERRKQCLHGNAILGASSRGHPPNTTPWLWDTILRSSHLSGSSLESSHQLLLSVIPAPPTLSTAWTPLSTHPTRWLSVPWGMFCCPFQLPAWVPQVRASQNPGMWRMWRPSGKQGFRMPHPFCESSSSLRGNHSEKVMNSSHMANCLTEDGLCHYPFWHKNNFQ